MIAERRLWYRGLGLRLGFWVVVPALYLALFAPLRGWSVAVAFAANWVVYTMWGRVAPGRSLTDRIASVLIAMTLVVLLTAFGREVAFFLVVSIFGYS